MKEQLRILVVSPLAYHPDCGNGGGVICYAFLKELATRHSLAFVGFGCDSSEETEVARRSLERVAMSVEIVPLTLVNFVSRQVRRVTQLFGQGPVDVLSYESSEMYAALERKIATWAPDVILIQFPYMAHFVGRGSSAVRIMDVQDVFFVSRLREFAVQQGLFGRLRKLVSWLAWTFYEMRWYSRFDLLMALSAQDEMALKCIVPATPVFTSEIGFSFPADSAHIVEPVRGRFGFVGNFQHPPNLDALRWLVEEIVPGIRRRTSEVTVHVAGKGIPAKYLDSCVPGVTFAGFVADLGGFVQSCEGMLAPLRFGGGVKVKVVESLGYGRPVIGTPIAADGIVLKEDEGMVVASTTEEIIESVLLVTRERERFLRAGRLGADRVRTIYGVEVKAKKFEQQVQSLLELQSRPRNALGSLR